MISRSKRLPLKSTTVERLVTRPTPIISRQDWWHSFATEPVSSLINPVMSDHSLLCLGSHTARLVRGATFDQHSRHQAASLLWRPRDEFPRMRSN
jgi:hypothetical protein